MGVQEGALLVPMGRRTSCTTPINNEGWCSRLSGFSRLPALDQFQHLFVPRGRWSRVYRREATGPPKKAGGKEL
jgi:hypothetical protein